MGRWRGLHDALAGHRGTLPELLAAPPVPPVSDDTLRAPAPRSVHRALGPLLEHAGPQHATAASTALPERMTTDVLAGGPLPGAALLTAVVDRRPQPPRRGWPGPSRWSARSGAVPAASPGTSISGTAGRAPEEAIKLLERGDHLWAWPAGTLLCLADTEAVDAVLPRLGLDGSRRRPTSLRSSVPGSTVKRRRTSSSGSCGVPGAARTHVILSPPWRPASPWTGPPTRRNHSPTGRTSSARTVPPMRYGCGMRRWCPNRAPTAWPAARGSPGSGPGTLWAAGSAERRPPSWTACSRRGSSAARTWCASRLRPGCRSAAWAAPHGVRTHRRRPPRPVASSRTSCAPNSARTPVARHRGAGRLAGLDPEWGPVSTAEALLAERCETRRWPCVKGGGLLRSMIR